MAEQATVARWTVGAFEEWAAGDFRQLLVMSVHGARAILYDDKGGAAAFIPAEAEAERVAVGEDDLPWCIITENEEGLPTYEAALAEVQAAEQAEAEAFPSPAEHMTEAERAEWRALGKQTPQT